MYIVCGNFGKDRKGSYIGQRLREDLNAACLNGGSMDDLHNIDFTKIDTLLWMPNIDNNEKKILPEIKKINNKLLLISTKNVVGKDFTTNDMIGRLLKTKSNLGIMIDKINGIYSFILMDPLGNVFFEGTDLYELALVIKDRVTFLKSLTRVSSESVGPSEDFWINNMFLDEIKRFGNIFTHFVNAINPNRLLGNASTRCAKGFPSLKNDIGIFVTKRNVDKRHISNEDFVNVFLDNNVKYYGEYKPSVDTPIQLMLYEYYKNIKYMIHGHVYVEGAAITESKIPCGHIEEFNEIIKVQPDKELKTFAVNLRGHGCVILCHDLESFDKIEIKGRPFPEY